MLIDIMEPDLEDLYWQCDLLPTFINDAETQAKRIYMNQLVYDQVEHLIGINSRVIGAIHAMEANCNLERRINDGSTLLAGTDWVHDAVATLEWDLKKFRTPPASLADNLHFIEAHNGLGYRSRGILSPYLFSGTDLYDKGKFDKDGHYNPDLISKQVGAIPILKMLVTLYPGLKLNIADTKQ